MDLDIVSYASHLDDCPWESKASDPTRTDVVRWKQMVSAGRRPSAGVSMGLLEFPVGTSIRLHHHTPPEIYYVKSGLAKLRLAETVQSLRAGGFAYIPGSAPHAIANIGQERMELIWVFPTDTWDEVEYLYLE